MDNSFPFFSSASESAGPGIYHSHPQCRIAQGIAPAARIVGTGEGRAECPFCYVLAQFQASRLARSQKLPLQPNLKEAVGTGRKRLRGA
jgi:hypothetical protein